MMLEPIETAPKDGTHILGFDGYETFCFRSMCFAGGYWIFDGDDAFEASHWMPEPDYPQLKRSEATEQSGKGE